MKYYNLYYKDALINNRPLTEEEALSVYKESIIYKYDKISKRNIPIETKNIQYVKTIII